MKIVFSGLKIAEEGDGFTDMIDLSPPSRTAASETVKLRGSRGVYRKSNGQAEYSVKATVPYFCDSHAAAIAKIAEISGILDGLGEGALSIEGDVGQASVTLENCTAEAVFPDEISGSFFEVEYEFRGGFFDAAAVKAVAPEFGGFAISIGGEILTISRE